jgi:RecA-family ATPase
MKREPPRRTTGAAHHSQWACIVTAPWTGGDGVARKSRVAKMKTADITQPSAYSRFTLTDADRYAIAQIQQEAPQLSFEQAQLLHEYRHKSYGITALQSPELRFCEALEDQLARSKAAAAIPLRANSNDGYERSAGADQRREPHAKANDAAKPLAMPMLDVSAWDGVPVPARDWAVRDRIIRRAVTLLSGEGGIGKSILILQLACAHVLARDWFGQLPEPGPVLYLNAEDDERELHFRLAAIVTHLKTSFGALKDLHLVPLAGEDALLGVPDRTGIIQPTPLFERLLRAAEKIQPVLIALDTAADMFGGNENDRSQVRQFISLLRRLAITGNSAVLLASHPSLSGINSNSGLSGSTGWHNSVRSRLFFKASESDDGVSRDLRELEVKKNNYGPTGEVVRMVWRNGVFVPVSSPSSMERAAADQKVEDLFLDLLDRHNRQGQPVSPHPTSPSNYAPTVFAKHREAKGTGKTAFADAMQRLLDAGAIRIEISGPPSKQRARLVRT